MNGRVHLFLAITPIAFGEAVIALRLARELDARGDRVDFLAPAGLGVLLRGSPVRFGVIDKPFWKNIDDALTGVLRKQRYASLVLVDATQVFFGLLAFGQHDRLPGRIDAPVLALDMWNLPETNLEWDTGPRRWPIPTAAAALRRLVPVPLVRPGVAPELFNGLPPAAASRRVEARARAGLSSGDRLILVTTASWQALSAQVHPYHVHLTQLLPALLVSYLARLGSAVRIAHVGPTPLPRAGKLSNYRFLAPMPPDAFQDLVASSDLVLSMNVAATTIASALRHDVPVVAIVNSRTARDADELAATLPGPPSPSLAARLADIAPIQPFSVWPLGLHAFLGPVLRDNPYVDAIDLLELLDEETFIDRCLALLFEPTARADAAARRARYVARVDELATPADAFETALRH